MANHPVIAMPPDRPGRGKFVPGIPANAEPYWLRHENRLAGFQSDNRLPDFADVVVIGAGLTGASAAYHLAR